MDLPAVPGQTNQVVEPLEVGLERQPALLAVLLRDGPHEVLASRSALPSSAARNAAASEQLRIAPPESLN